MELTVIVIVSLLLVPVVLFTDGALKAIVGGVFLLFGLGYALVAALFPRKGSLDGLERLGLSFGLSMVVTPSIGLILLLTPWGLRIYPLLISFVSCALVLASIAWYRRQKLDPSERFELKLSPKASFPADLWRRLSLGQKLLTALLIVAIMGTLVTFATVTATPKVREKFTEFYILGPQGAILDYPKTVRVGEEAIVRLVIANREHEPIDYNVEIMVGQQKMGETGPITLAHDQVWEQEVPFVPLRPGRGQRVEFLLYRGASTELYQVLYINIDVVGGS